MEKKHVQGGMEEIGSDRENEETRRGSKAERKGGRRGGLHKKRDGGQVSLSLSLLEDKY